jgi:hypothetical protein
MYEQSYPEQGPQPDFEHTPTNHMIKDERIPFLISRIDGARNFAEALWKGIFGDVNKYNQNPSNCHIQLERYFAVRAEVDALEAELRVRARRRVTDVAQG